MGAVTFYNDMKGFGFVRPDNGMRSLAEGQKVLFDTAEDRRSVKTAASNTRKA
ncbi:cold-shock protein [Microvirga sp. TS319]|uniref:cold-shock protein n=1 Tax=Microvirga sp. TS319 TaxID=3241165 RepID=UPI00351A31F0